MRTTARVAVVRGDRALLSCDEAGPTCGACSAGHGCMLRRLARPGGPLLEVPARAGNGSLLRPGDDVVVDVADGELLAAAARAYVPPLAGLLTVPAIVATVARGSELQVLLAAATGLVAGWLLARFWLRRSPPRYRLLPSEDA